MCKTRFHASCKMMLEKMYPLKKCCRKKWSLLILFNAQSTPQSPLKKCCRKKRKKERNRFKINASRIVALYSRIVRCYLYSRIVAISIIFSLFFQGRPLGDSIGLHKSERSRLFFPTVRVFGLTYSHIDYTFPLSVVDKIIHAETGNSQEITITFVWPNLKNRTLWKANLSTNRR